MNLGKAHPSWQNIPSLYERHAEYFDKSRGKNLVEQPWLDMFLATAGPASDILDLGCGSGEPLAAYFIAKGHTATGVDASAPLLALCKARFPDHEWLLGDMQHCQLGKKFMGIIAWDSFFHLTPDGNAECSLYSSVTLHPEPHSCLPLAQEEGRLSGRFKARHCTTPAWRQMSMLAFCLPTALRW